MKTKLRLLVLMIALTALAAFSVPQRVAACSGDDCGCEFAEADCDAACPPPGDPAHNSCHLACAREFVRCGLACCGKF